MRVWTKAPITVSNRSGPRRTTGAPAATAQIGNDIRAAHVERTGGEAAIEAAKRQLLAEVIGHRLGEVRRARGLTQQHVADRLSTSLGGSEL